MLVSNLLFSLDNEEARTELETPFLPLPSPPRLRIKVYRRSAFLQPFSRKLDPSFQGLPRRGAREPEARARACLA